MGHVVFHDDCSMWRLLINTDQTKVMVFRKDSILSKDDHWFYGDNV